MGVPIDEQVVQAEQSKQKDKMNKKLLDIYLLVKENNNLLKNKNSGSGGAGTVTYEGMINYIAQRPMWKLTDRQIYWCVEQNYPIEYIQALSGYKPEEIKKKYEQHKKNNVYR